MFCALPMTDGALANRPLNRGSATDRGFQVAAPRPALAATTPKATPPVSRVRRQLRRHNARPTTRPPSVATRRLRRMRRISPSLTSCVRSSPSRSRRLGSLMIARAAVSFRRVTSTRTSTGALWLFRVNDPSGAMSTSVCPVSDGASVMWVSTGPTGALTVPATRMPSHAPIKPPARMASTRPVRTPPSARPSRRTRLFRNGFASQRAARPNPPETVPAISRVRSRSATHVVGVRWTSVTLLLLPSRRLVLAGHQVGRISPRNNVGDNDAMLDMTRDEFEGLVSEALDLIPPELTALMRNVVVLVEDDPPAHDPELLGLYEGVPLTERGSGYGGGLPGRVLLFPNPP